MDEIIFTLIGMKQYDNYTVSANVDSFVLSI